MAYNPHMVEGQQYSTWDYFEQATGSFVFLGGARVTEKVHTAHWGDLYPAVEGTFEAYGWLKASWSHDNEVYVLNLFIYSLPTTPAMIGSDPDAFIHSDIMVPTEHLLGFIGTLKRGSVVERVQGNLGFFLLSLGNEFTLAQFHIYSLTDGKAVEFWWANSDLSLELPGNQLLVVPAARVFIHEVTIIPI